MHKKTMSLFLTGILLSSTLLQDVAFANTALENIKVEKEQIENVLENNDAQEELISLEEEESDEKTVIDEPQEEIQTQEQKQKNVESTLNPEIEEVMGLSENVSSPKAINWLTYLITGNNGSEITLNIGDKRILTNPNSVQAIMPSGFVLTSVNLKDSNNTTISQGNDATFDIPTTLSEGNYKLTYIFDDDDGDSQTDSFTINIQNTQSFVDIDSSLSSSSPVDEPERITVGRDENDTYGEYTYHWEILDELGEVALEDDNTQPDMTQVNALPAGTYTVRNTVVETPEGGAVLFDGETIEDTKEGTFVLHDGTLVVEHRLIEDEGAESVLYETTTESRRVGTNYTSEEMSIPGYKLTEVPDNATGTFSHEEQTVIYVYERTEAAPVKVKYQDEQGNDLSASDSLNGKVGLPYETTPKSINGWVLKSTPDNATGTFSHEEQTVIYVYAKDNVEPDTPWTDLNPSTPVISEDPTTEKPKQVSKNPDIPKSAPETNTLPETGESKQIGLIVLGWFLLLASFIALIAQRKNLKKS